MTIAASRALQNDDVCFVGIGAPSAACNVARLTHAPDITLIYESGTIGTAPDVLPLSIGDGELCETAVTTVSVPEMFRYWLQGGRISIGFLGAAQLDRFGNINTTVIGDYVHPKVRLPGGGGAPEIATSCGEIFITMAQTKRGMVEKIDFFTSFGHGEGGDHRKRLGIDHRGPDLADHRSRHLEAGSGDQGIHGRVAASRRHAPAGAGELRLGGQASPRRLTKRRRQANSNSKTLRDLQARTKAAHEGPEEKAAWHGRGLSSATIIRTPIGRFGGSLSSVRADDLGAIPLKALVAAQCRRRLAGGRRRDLWLRQPGRRGQSQRGAHGAAAGRPAEGGLRHDRQPPVRLGHGRGDHRRARHQGRRGGI